MWGRIWFLFWVLIALFIVVPILNQVVQVWTAEDGVLDTTFNTSDLAAWNTSGQILTAADVAAMQSTVALTPFEEGFTQMYVILIVIFLVIIIFYVLGKSRGGDDMGGME